MVFGEAYANQYDTFYAGKDYSGECDLIEEVFRRFGSGEIRSLVDWGCGTGSHSIPLAQRGYAVTGVDRSPDMLRLARQKSSENNLGIEWIDGDVRVAPAGGPFDAGLFMFAVLGYLSSNADLIAALGNARRHLRVGGLLIFDVWYGPAVLALKPSDRIKIVSLPEGKLLRVVSSSLDTRHHLDHVKSNSWRIIGDRVVEESEEMHTVRYFFPMELELVLERSGFALAALTAFPTLDITPDETSWNVLAVARVTST
jgi:SAM-dependent methyltransferase